MKKNVFVILATFLSLFLLHNAWSEHEGFDATLLVSVKNLSSSEGQILINLYKSKQGFPTNPKKALEKVIIPAGKHKTQFKITEPGEYAIAVCHDENNNSYCDTNIIGIPKEGVGVSRNAKGILGPPKFKDAKLDVQAGDIPVEIILSY